MDDKKKGRRKFIKEFSLFTFSTTVLSLESHNSYTDHIRFGLTTDSHYANRDVVGTRYYRDSLQKMQEFVETMNDARVDFVVHLGDLKDEAPDKSQESTIQFLKEIEAVYAKFNGPRYHCIGNHDVDSINKAQFLSLIENTGIPKQKSYYSFDIKGFHFIVLDANYHRNGLDHFYKEGANWEDTNITSKQIRWLKQDLKTHDKPTIIFCHHPLFEFFRDDHKYHVNNYKELQEIIHSSSKTIAVFQGHVHEERFKKINGVHYVTQLGMVDYQGLENNSFALVEIKENTLSIKGYKRTSSMEKTI